MNDARNTPQTAPPRARRRAAGLVAQYIHELSQQHRAVRQASPAVAAEPASAIDQAKSRPTAELCAEGA